MYDLLLENLTKLYKALFIDFQGNFENSVQAIIIYINFSKVPTICLLTLVITVHNFKIS